MMFHVLDKKGACFEVNLEKKETITKQFNILGDQPSFMKVNQFVKTQLLIGSKDYLLQIWDVNQKDKPFWQSRNLPNDDLDLKVPIWDTDATFFAEKNFAVCTAFCDVREYDLRTSG